MAHAIEQEKPLEVDMTPLIDVVFLLLIFFIIVSVFNKMEKMAKLKLPQARSVIFRENVAKDRLVVNIETDGTIVIYNQRTSLAGFKNVLSRKASALKARQKQTGQAPIIIRGDKKVPYKHIKGILKAIYKHQFTKIMFAAYKYSPERTR